MTERVIVDPLAEKLNERLPSASRSRMLENLWVAGGVAGWMFAGWVIWKLFATWPQPDWVVAGALMVAVFFLTAGLYAVLSFGLDEWKESGERRELFTMLIERDEEIEALNRKLREAYEGWEGAQRPIIVSTPNSPVARTPEVIQHVRRILFRRDQRLVYSRTVMCDDFKVLTQAEWTEAIQLLASPTIGHARRAGRGDLRPDGTACKSGEWVLSDAPESQIVNDCMVALGFGPHMNPAGGPPPPTA